MAGDLRLWIGGLTLGLGIGWAGYTFAEAFIAKEGKPCAEIVISENPTRMVKLAAAELQTYLEKISGAKLPIVTDPSRKDVTKIYVGRSKHTDRLNISTDGLKHDAFRIVSGEDWLALVGADKDFVPREPSGHSREDSKRVLQEWDALTGEKWGCPHISDFKMYHKGLDIWEQDGRGSINAVYEFLRGLGVRWYFPGELGEVLPPKQGTIPIPKINKLFQPDFPVRNLYFYYNRFFMASKDEVLWQLRLGLNTGNEVLGVTRGHGIVPVHNREEVKKAHPEYFALWAGKRAIDHKEGCGAPCLSSEGLFQQNVKYVRALYDIYGEPMVNVSPADGYTNLCQCELCRGKGTPERGWRGQLSDYVWSYVERVAREVYKTHPDRKVSCIAYGAYQLPPEKIEKLSPNIVVTICRSRSQFYDPETREHFRKLTKAWREKLPSKEIYIWDYYLHARPGGAWEGVPVYFTRVIADDLRFLKGISGGDGIEVSRYLKDDFKAHSLASNHLNVYVTARLYWDVNQDLDSLLEEYYEKFYGPARAEMKAFVEYAEANWPNAAKDVKIIDRLTELLDAARKAAGDTIYGKRIELISNFMSPLKQRREQLVKGREGVPRARAYLRKKADLKLDGKLDEPFWEGMAVYSLLELATGKEPHHRTTFKVACTEDSVCFGIVCEERDMKNLNITSTRDGDTNVWLGDNIELLLETQAHSYYQIAISPAGAITNADRKKGIDTLWSSGAKAAAYHGENYWSLEVVIPVAGDAQEELDPRNGVAGRKPSATYPWYFNLCRQRIRDKEREHSAFSPTGKSHFHDVMKFAELYMR